MAPSHLTIKNPSVPKLTILIVYDGNIAAGFAFATEIVPPYVERDRDLA